LDLRLAGRQIAVLRLEDLDSDLSERERDEEDIFHHWVSRPVVGSYPTPIGRLPRPSSRSSSR
jgi:hypothetical protein